MGRYVIVGHKWSNEVYLSWVTNGNIDDFYFVPLQYDNERTERWTKPLKSAKPRVPLNETRHKAEASNQQCSLKQCSKVNIRGKR